ncbi:hypothetical protein B0T14DRAFT_561438 [Immersiella caudata]|uniref:Chitin-binding type-1 domain-containing protein n=1 Tax=Immersiella caudata TaxID=314043 RepID=A0AA39XH46_9PEZI|nr:hypothetical protein B0T14DRAFT_561438 [Immersiella caudata]
MLSTRLLPGLVALAISVGVQTQGTSSCVETVTARTGDTCASLAELVSISVTDFLRSNPSVTSCSALIGGAVYCKTGVASGPPTIPASLPPASGSNGDSTSEPLSVSTDGVCGGTVTCEGSQFGRCCSAHGYCGSTSDYCSDGCQDGLGECGDGDEPPETVIVPISTEVAISTKVISATRTVQATVVVTNTVLVTDTLTARASTRILTLTSSDVHPPRNVHPSPDINPPCGLNPPKDINTATHDLNCTRENNINVNPTR